jgi:hypothetical protein
MPVTSSGSTFVVVAGDNDQFGQYSLHEMKATSQPEGRYGSPAGNMAYDRAIVLGSGPAGVNVRRGETIKFVIPATGREFRWRFDTLRQIDAFPLSRIAPTDVQTNPNATVHVSGDPMPS